jgi:zinc transporter ZupT
MTAVFVTIATFFSTMLGGYFALRLKDQLHLILGFSAGAVMGVAFFDLMPESLDLASGKYAASEVLGIVALGFALYMVVDRLLLGHSHNDPRAIGNFGAGTLSIHSFLDGVAIGLGFKVSATVGLIVAAAVLTHDFSDGINTVNFVLKNNGEKSRARRWLFVDALAPVVGVLSTLIFSISGPVLGLLLALYAGFFLYIGASDLVPESYHAHPVSWTTVATVLGMGVLFLIVKAAG